MTNSRKLLVSIPEAAVVVGLGRTKLYELVARGEIATVRIGRAVRVPVRALEDFVERLQEQGEI
jgi:excisionase family DNA binding protein